MQVKSITDAETPRQAAWNVAALFAMSSPQLSTKMSKPDLDKFLSDDV